ncbi:MAG: TetR/AcrR family transcriptional regulator [Treponema sp.]|jgi:AcrR family transcriptional regulator|nr:TetR/AcrR family transcriptional regulator [Treponema sp.]
MQNNNEGTKSLIFNTALRLFAKNGYENVSVREIADAVGIKSASIYNHYETKEQILDTCYSFYLKNRNSLRLNREQYDPILRNGTKEEVLNIFNYPWEDSVKEQMFFALLIYFSRIYTDAKAREMYENEITESMKYQKEVFDFGIKIGRFHEFNVTGVSLIILSTRLFAAHFVTITPEQEIELRKAEEDAMDELVRLVPFKY